MTEQVETTQEVEVKMYLEEMFRSKFSIFDGLRSDVKRRQIEKIHYIETIAKDMEKDLSGVDLYEVFPNDNGKITASQKEINKILMKFEREAVAVLEKEDFVMTDEIAENVLDATQFLRDKELTTTKTKITSILSGLQQLNTDIAQNHSDLAKNRRILDQLESQEKSTKILDEINQLLNEGLITEVFKIKDGKITLASSNIVAYYKKPSAKIDIRVDFGIFKYEIDCTNFRLKVKRGARNFEVNGHLHPHLGSSGDICLGNMSELMQEATSNFNIYDMVNIAHQVFVNYNQDNPYVSLEQFAEKSSQMQPSGNYLTDEIEVQVTCSNCENEFTAMVEGGEGSCECGECGSVTNYVE